MLQIGRLPSQQYRCHNGTVPHHPAHPLTALETSSSYISSLAPKLILATGEAAEPFLELSVGLDSFHIRMARLLAARGSDKLSSYTGEKGVGKGNTMQKKGSYLWQPCCLRPKTAIPPSSIPCPQNKSVRKICQRLLTLDKV